jgi:hypothetical protein
MSNARELAELSGSYGTGGFVGMKNRIINGAMMIDQRNAGDSFTPATGAYTLDRWAAASTQTSKFTVQQSTDVPSGFKNSLKVTSSSAYSVSGEDYFAVYQRVEGYNVSDLGFGAAGASSVTFSFWVKSSLTGSFGGSIQNGAQNRCYSFAYTVSTANTWEYKTVTAVGDTTGTWNTGNTSGMIAWFGLGATGTRVGTAGAWGTQSGAGLQPSGAVSVVGTNGATFYITGVQLEKGSTATSFDYRPYGTELALCQRYYEKSYAQDVKPATATTSETTRCVFPALYTTYFDVQFKVSKRVSPTMVAYSPYSGNSGRMAVNMNTDVVVTWVVNGPSSSTAYAAYNSNVSAYMHFTAESEL